MIKVKRAYPFGAFLALPMCVLNCPSFRQLSSNEIKLLINISAQFNGKNNGDFCAAWKFMSQRGWKSEATLNRAKKELIAAGFLCETRKGWLTNLCSLFGITWQPLNPNKKFDIGPGGLRLVRGPNNLK
jgi:hypothetical protein